MSSSSSITDTCKSTTGIHFPQHPMENYAILKAMFNQCDVQTLAKFRFVCKLWHTASLNIWREKATLQITSVKNDSPRLSMRKFEELLVAETETDAEVKYQLVSKPFRNISFSQFSFITRHQLNFWNTCGQWIRKLSMTECSFSSFENFTEIVINGTPKLEELVITRCDMGPMARARLLRNLVRNGAQTNLKRFSLEPRRLRLAHHYLALPEHQTNPMNWRELFHCYPNIQKLVLHSFARFHWCLEELFNAIRDTQKGNITHLDIMKMYSDINTLRVSQEGLDVFPSSCAELLTNLKLPLETLKIDLGRRTENNVIKQLLHAHAGTLKELQCFRAGCVPRELHVTLFNFPFNVTYESLKTLHLYGRITQSLDFLEYTPNLECLHLFLWKNVYTEPTFPDIDSWVPRHHSERMRFHNERNRCKPKLERMTEFAGDFYVGDMQTFRRISELMPNIRRLRIGLENAKQLFPVLCRAWEDSLEELELGRESDVDDESLTGISKEVWSRLVVDGVGDFQTATGAIYQPPNLIDLQALRKFWYYPKEGHRLTEHAVNLAFLSLPHLDSLRIRVGVHLDSGTTRALKESISDLRVFE